MPGQRTNRELSHLPVLSGLLYEPLREACKAQRNTRGNNMQHILVTGGAGRLGRLVVKYLSAAGYRVRGMSRRASPGEDWPGAEWVQADLETGAGLTEAGQGIGVVVHAATGGNRHSWQIDVEGTRRLLEAAREARGSHVVSMSV